MQYHAFVIKYAEIGVKGKNRYIFEDALVRQIKKPDENPSVGLLLCASKNDEVVEYAVSRTLSPMMVAEYQLHLPDKDVLRKKLQEFVKLPSGTEDYTNEDQK